MNMQLEILRSQRNIDNIDKQSDERNQIKIINDKDSDVRDQVGRNKEESLNTDKEFLNMIKLSSKRYIDNIDKQSDERNQIDISNDKDSDKRDHMGKNDEERVTDDIEVLKLVKLSSWKNIYNIEKEYDERNWMDMRDNKDSDERHNIGKNDEERVTDGIEVLKLGKLSSQKNIYNIEK